MHPDANALQGSTRHTAVIIQVNFMEFCELHLNILYSAPTGAVNGASRLCCVASLEDAGERRDPRL